MVTAYLHLAPRLRMSGAIPLLPVYAFMAWTGTALPFFLANVQNRVACTQKA